MYDNYGLVAEAMIDGSAEVFYICVEVFFFMCVVCHSLSFCIGNKRLLMYAFEYIAMCV